MAQTSQTAIVKITVYKWGSPNSKNTRPNSQQGMNRMYTRKYI